MSILATVSERMQEDHRPQIDFDRLRWIFRGSDCVIDNLIKKIKLNPRDDDFEVADAFGTMYLSNQGRQEYTDIEWCVLGKSFEQDPQFSRIALEKQEAIRHAARRAGVLWTEVVPCRAKSCCQSRGYPLPQTWWQRNGLRFQQPESLHNDDQPKMQFQEVGGGGPLFGGREKAAVQQEIDAKIQKLKESELQFRCAQEEISSLLKRLQRIPETPYQSDGLRQEACMAHTVPCVRKERYELSRSPAEWDIRKLALSAERPCPSQVVTDAISNILHLERSSAIVFRDRIQSLLSSDRIQREGAVVNSGSDHGALREYLDAIDSVLDLAARFDEVKKKLDGEVGKSPVDLQGLQELEKCCEDLSVKASFFP